MDTIVEYVVDAIERYADGVASKLDHIEERILADDMSEGRNMLGRIRRTTVRLHRQLVILRSLMQRFELDVSETLALKLTTSKLRQRLDWLDIEVVSLRGPGASASGGSHYQDRRADQPQPSGSRHRHHDLSAGNFGYRHLRHERDGTAADPESSRVLLVDADSDQLIGACALAFEKIRDLRPLRLCVRAFHEPKIARNAPPYEAAWYLPAQKVIDAGERPDRIAEAWALRLKRACYDEGDLLRIARRSRRVLIRGPRHPLHPFAIGAA
jgi:hypothetical protein